MNKNKFLTCAALVSLMLCSCINDSYDLSNIDTTAKIGVNNLVVPINLDAITLDKVLNMSEDGMINKVTDPSTGESIYAAVSSGTFLSSTISVPEIHASKPDITKIQSDIDMEVLTNTPFTSLDEYIQQLKNEGTFDPAKMDEYEDYVWNQVKPSLDPESPLCRYSFDDKKTHYSTGSKSVDKTVRSIDRVTCEAAFAIDFHVLQLKDLVTVRLRDLKLMMPKGLMLYPNHGTYDSETGIYDLSHDEPYLKNGVIAFNGKEGALEVNFMGIDAKAAGIVLEPKEDAEGEVTIAGDIEVLSGVIEVYLNDFKDGNNIFDLPRTGLHYECLPELSDVDVKTFTGKIKYDIKDVDIDPIMLHDLPDILNDERSSVILDNPQVYVKANNPLAPYNVKAQTGFQFSGERNGEKRPVYSLDEGTVTIEKDMASFCMSPTKPKKYYSGFEDAEYARFTGLKNILKGNGMPDRINVEVVEPCIPEQQVNDFELGIEMDAVEGEYTFFAPLSLDEGSVIVYEKVDKDWDEETLDNLVIESLKLTATATSQIPLGATLTLVPLGKDGKEISGVTITSSKLDANAQNQPVEFTQTSGTIRNLDGIQLRATIIGAGAEKTLQPVQNLDFKNIRVTVTGYYQDEL